VGILRVVLRLIAVDRTVAMQDRFLRQFLRLMKCYRDGRRLLGAFVVAAGGQLNVVCFRYRPAGVPEDELDALNQRLGEAVLADGRVYVGTTTYGGRVAFRPAIVNYRSTEADVDLLVDVIRELGMSLVVAQRR
jgi:glutamate/tyrosine decarboxylase-like PLP-dependent enzyme